MTRLSAVNSILERASDITQSLVEFVRSRVLIHGTFVFVSILLGYFAAHNVTLKDLSPVIGTLQNMSAAVFTLSGIWIAYTYPQAISAYTSPDTVKVIPNDETKRIENLVLIILSSAFVISGLLSFNFVYLVMGNTDLYAANRDRFKIFGVAAIGYFSIVQLRAIITVMLTNISFVNELHNKRTERKANSDL
ncbi:Uncharacterised protein [BD1-7 clade bacterium]|uniref:Uncharacterized protein n=1 Tax=BD1-7 clade bacterium TaxID=2029982 RepID=A0A5S9Q864_9GAMM|nr:Uncharacterised protein [BD1-7 clade bacterium]CAA0113757.1 Uncharacterised protein [BD1-7 clade bacterium]